MATKTKTIEPIIWRENSLFLLDQRVLPHQQSWIEFNDSSAVAEAIKTMVVRGAPAIGVAAAYGVVLAARQAWDMAAVNWKQVLTASLDELCLLYTSPSPRDRG